MKKILLLLAAGLMVSAYIIGCGTEEPWQPDPTRPLELSMVSGPADTVAYGSTISFSWTSNGGSGEVTYQYRLDSGTWSTASNVTSVSYSDVTAGATFSVMATDAASATVEVSRTFAVSAAQVDGDAPTVSITVSPAEGSFVATGGNVSVTWEGNDEVDGDNLLYWYSFAGTTSDTSTATTALFPDVTAGAAVFSVWALDQTGNASAAATVSFTIQDATILYVDDFQWFDAAGNVDMPKERDQKQFYRDALEGYAFAEWDIAVQGMPDSAYVLNFSTIVFCSDSDLDDGSSTWWYEIGANGGGVLRYHMDNGGNLLATGPLILQWIWNNIPPLPGDFEFDWLGVDSSGSWDYWWWLTWGIKDTATTLNLPDSMKVDVAKNGDQDDYAEETPYLRNDGTVTTEVLFTWGLWVDGSEPIPYGNPIAHITRFDGTARSAMLDFDTYDMPLSDIRQTFQAILTEFGE